MQAVGVVADVLQHMAMNLGHSLGLARGTRGVEQIGHGVGGNRRQGRAGGGLPVDGIQVDRWYAAGVQCEYSGGILRVRHDHLGLGVGDDAGQPVLGMGGIKRDIDFARL